MHSGKPVRAALAAVFSMSCLLSALPAGAETINAKTARAKDEIPTCNRNLGALAIREPDNKWWEGLGLESPEALIKVFVQRSRCFTLVDRGKGFELAQQERALAAGGQLQGGANIGGGQVRAADYIMVPDIVSKNGNSGGTNIGGLLGGFIGGGVGMLVSGISINSKTADVVLTITNVRTSEQEAMEEGHGSKTDVGFSLGGAGGGFGGFGGAGVSNYQNTAIGQVVILAYIEAYTKLVTDMGGLSADAKTEAPTQTVTMSRAGSLRETPDEKGKVLKTIDPGTILYPTGQKNGPWWEVADEIGNKGWVSSLSLSLAK